MVDSSPKYTPNIDPRLRNLEISIAETQRDMDLIRVELQKVLNSVYQSNANQQRILNIVERWPFIAVELPG